MTFSAKQLQVLCWWQEGSPFASCDGIICDGAIRSGKTSAMSLSFVLWAMKMFSGRDFALCGKTVKALRRNFGTALIATLRGSGFRVTEQISKDMFTVASAGRSNRFHFIGGRDESSAALIQGMTLAGVLFDEVALMPRGFVSQATARCSVEGAKLWFNCNPEGPSHWFFREWVLKAKERNLLHLHFVMDDNPSLSEAVKKKYRSTYSGAFFRRFILGEWVIADGLVYPEAAKDAFTRQTPQTPAEEYVVSVDYGTVNPFSAGLWGRRGKEWQREDEFYFDSRSQGRQLTDEEYYAELEAMTAGKAVSAVIIDPSAASFIQTVASHGRFVPLRAKNEVVSGIRAVQSAFKGGKLFIDPKCHDALREFSLYRWNDRGSADCVIKENDHAMDDIRYFAATWLCGGGSGFAAVSVERRDENEKEG